MSQLIITIEETSQDTSVSVSEIISNVNVIIGEQTGGGDMLAAVYDPIIAANTAKVSNVDTEEGVLELASSGIHHGGLVTVNADNTKFDVAAGAGWIVTHDAGVPSTITEVVWTAFTAQTVTNLATSFATDLAIDMNGNILQQDSFTDLELRSLIQLGGVDHSNQINIINTFPIQIPTSSVASNLAELAKAVGDINLLGNNYAANGANLSIDKSGGLVYSYGKNNAADPDNPSKLTTTSQVAIGFGYVYDNGAGFGTFNPPTTFIDPNNYDDGTGTLATVGNNKFTIQRILYFPNASSTFVQYGTEVHNNLTDALDAVPRSSFPSLVGIRTAMVRGYIVVQEGVTDLSLGTVFLSADKFGNVAGLEAGSTTASWGNITGTLSNQADLQTELDTKLIDAPSDGTGYVRKDGAWAAETVGGGGSELKVYRTTDNVRINENANPIDEELQVTLEANSYYELDYKLRFQSDEAADFRATLVVPTGATGSITNSNSGANNTSGLTSIMIFSTVTTTEYWIFVKGHVQTVDAGVFGVAWSGRYNVAFTTTLFKGSNLTLTKLV